MEVTGRRVTEERLIGLTWRVKTHLRKNWHSRKRGESRDRRRPLKRSAEVRGSKNERTVGSEVKI